MRTIILALLFPLVTAYSQVGISTTDPKATLDIKASNVSTPANTDGILIPRVDALSVTNPTIDQDRMLIYLTTTSGTYVPGFYYWDNANSVWKGLGEGKEWSITGNAGTSATTNFLGTTDDNDLIFKRNNTRAGRIGNNISFGINALNPLTTGTYNLALGTSALASNTTGRRNIANGYQALSNNTTGDNNIANGFFSLLYNTTGSNNIANGYEALYANTTGLNNIANGYFSLWQNTTGFWGDPQTVGFAPWPHVGLCPQTPFIG